MAKVPDVLHLTEKEPGRYVAPNPEVDPEGRDVVFSGQILAQMIAAAAQAVGEDKETKSVHAIFARAGTYSAGPLDLSVDPMHSGRAWASCTVSAEQGDRLISRGLVLSNAVEPDLIRHAPAMPDVPGPDEANPGPPGSLFPGAEIRFVERPEAAEDGSSPVVYQWVRNAVSTDSVTVNQAILAWCQPGSIIGAAMRPHSDVVSVSDAHRSISSGVISHTTHFHDHADVGDWLLFVHEGTYAGNGRVFGHGAVFDRDGLLVSTFAQDGMARRAAGGLDQKSAL